MNKKGFAISGIIYSLLILFLLLIFGILSIMGARKLILDKLKNEVMEELNGEYQYKDNSGANRPELLDNMLPIKYENNNWLIADISQEWYNYDKKEWANAVVIRDDVIKDVSKNHNDITITDKYTNQDGMAYFDGADDYLDLGYKNYDFGSSISMVLRFKAHSIDSANNNNLFGNWQSAGFGFYLRPDGQLRFSLYNENISSYIYTLGPIIELDKWYTVVATYDGNTLKLYINGELYTSTTSAGEVKPSVVQFALGTNPDKNDQVAYFANTTISDAAVYTRVLNENEIEIDYSGKIRKFDEQQLLFGYDYFGSTQEYYQKRYQNKEKTVVSETDIDLWYVWIPRYKYQLFNANNGSVEEQEIQIQFENGTETTGTVKCIDAVSGSGNVSETCTNASNGNWYTHPAFTFGNEELTGFWVGKFEVSGSTDKITIKPNVISLRNQTISSFFTAIQNMGNTYSLNGDSHMMKNMEWGAVAYLSHSKYGMTEEIYINNSSSYYTGRSGGNVGGSTNTVAIQYPSSSTSSNLYYNYGYYTYDGKIVNYDGSIGNYASDRTLGTKASTTGNIYGVYDMSGGAWEYVMGNMVNSSGNFYSSGAEFSTPPDSIYYDSYTYGTSYATHGRGKLGDATKETLKIFGNNTGGWDGDLSGFTTSVYSWFARGGYYYDSYGAGLFFFYNNTGCSLLGMSTRAVLCK